MHTPLITDLEDVQVQATGEALFDGLTVDELTMLLNRYEHLARSDLGRITDDRTAIEAEIWHDIVNGPVRQYMDGTRTSAENRWIQLRSGDAICKPRGARCWTRMHQGDFELPKPVVIVTIVSTTEPPGLRLAVDNSEPANARSTAELGAIRSTSTDEPS